MSSTIPHPSPHRLPQPFREPPALSRVEVTGEPRPGLILLVNPFYPKDPHGSFGKHVLTPSLALTTLAGATPPGWTVRYWDENLLQGPPPFEPLPELVGITVHLTFADRAYRLARTFRALGARVVLGGLHVSACPDEAAPHADAIVTGDGVPVWPRLLADLRAGRLEPRYHGDWRELPYRDHPRPDRSILPRSSFLTTSSVIASRGCHNQCDFCCLATERLTTPYQTRPVADVVAEIRATGEPYSVFVDNNLGSRRDYLRSLCRALEPLGHIWSAAVTLDVTDEPDLVRDMGRAGCTGVFVGFETLSRVNLEAVSKRSPPPEEYTRRVRLFHDHGIQVNGSFVLGLDDDRPESFPELVGWIEAARLECATFQILTPYPGTPLFARLEAEGRLLHRSWSLYDTAHCVFRPRHLAPEELEGWYGWCYERVFSPASVWRRRPESLPAAGAYLAMTLLYKRCNPLWSFLIRRRLVRAAWRPLVQLSRLRHLAGRRRHRQSLEVPREADSPAPAAGR